MNIKYYLAFAMLSLLMMGCSNKVTVKDIVNNPREYVNKEVVVEGVVEDKFSLVFVSFFLLNDNTATIRVITENPLPKIGNNIEVRGEVHYHSFAGESIIVIYENPDN